MDIGLVAPTGIKTGNYTALDGELVLADVTGGSFTVTLPSPAPDRATVGVKFVKGSAPAAVTVAAGGTDTFNDNAATSLSLTALNQSVLLQYAAAVGVWYEVADSTPSLSLPYQFSPTSFGAKGDGQIITDGAITSGTATLTTVGVSAPSAPTVNNATTGGTVAAGTYQVEITYVNVNGETTASGSTSTTTTTGTSTITVTSPATSGNAYGYYAYVTQAGGGTYYRQQSAPTEIGTNLILTAPPTNTGPNPPGANTTASNPFKASDVGKAIMVKGAGASGVTTLVTTISGFTSAGSITLAANASTTVSSGAMVLWSTDDTSAIQSAVNAAVAYAQAGAGYCEVVFPPAPAGLFYGVAGALQTGGSTLGNAQITLPVIIGGGGTPGGTPCSNKVTLVLKGGEQGASGRYWNQIVPTTNVTLVSFGVFASLSAYNTSANANGNPALIGGPTGTNGYGTSALRFSNMMVTVKGLSVLTTHSASAFGYCAFWFQGVACANLFDVSYGTTGLYYSGDFSSGNVANFTNGNSIGLGMPAAGNNDSNQIRNLICTGGYKYGLFATEHTDIQGATLLYCYAGLCPVGSYGDGGTALGALHAVKVSQLSCETCSNHVYVIGTGQGGVAPILHGVLDSEASPTFADQSSGSGLAALRGRLELCGASGTITVTHGTTLQIINEHQSPGPVTALGFTAGTAVQNTYWRPANVLLAGGTTVTAVKVSALAGGSSAPAMTTVYSQAAAALPFMTIRVPPGAWIEVDGDVPATNSWILD